MENFLNPEEVLSQLDLSSEMTTADFGSGSGGWALALAKKLENGKVYAIDILEEPLSVLSSKAQAENLRNIETIRSNVESKNGSKLVDNSCDLVLLTNLLFQAEDKKAVLNEASRVLRVGGKVLVVDWDKKCPFGPRENATSAEDIKKLCQKTSLNIIKEFRAGTFHWGLILEKS